MLKKYRLVLTVAALLALALCIAWLDSSSQPTHAQRQNQGAANSSKAPAKYSPLKDFWDWTTRDPVSFYTFVLAIFTGVLGGVAIIQIRYLSRADEIARLSAEAAKASAEALPAVERSYVFLAEEIKHKQTPNAIPNTGDIVEVHFAFKNHGKPPAILTKIEAEVRTVTSLPTEIRKYAIEFPPGFIISSGETTPLSSVCELGHSR